MPPPAHPLIPQPSSPHPVAFTDAPNLPLSVSVAFTEAPNLPLSESIAFTEAPNYSLSESVGFTGLDMVIFMIKTGYPKDFTPRL